MPFLIEIRCPTNGLRFASFPYWGQYHYRTGDGEFHLEVDYAWCARCDRFVECEKLPMIEDLKRIVAQYDANRPVWPELDAHQRKYFRDTLQRELPSDLTQRALHAKWSAALTWRQTRTTPARCLECASFFAITVIPKSENVQHPAGDCLVRRSGGDHVSIAAFPDQIFYNGDGIRVAQESFDDYRRRKA